MIAIVLRIGALNGQSLDVNSLDKAFSAFLLDDHIKHGQASLSVINGATGELLYSRNAETGMAPASTLKVLTSILGYKTLGPGFKWQTRLAYTGTINKGILDGDVIVIGGGDPTLGSDRFAQSAPSALLKRWTVALKNLGITHIKGRIIGDDSLFGSDVIPQGWIWQDIGNYYGGGASSLSWCENSFDINIRPGRSKGSAVSISVSDPVPGLRLVNEVSAGALGSGDNVYAYSAPFTDIAYVRGTYAIDLTKPVKLSLPDPAFKLAADLRSALVSGGVLVTGEASTTRRLSLRGESPAATKVIDTYESPEYDRVVYWLNKKSINLYAENILKTISLKSHGASDFKSGAKLLSAFAEQELGLDPAAISVLDGSGLSPENRVTTLCMARSLAYARKQDWYSSFYNSLPLYNGMSMKSGSIRNVLCYAGVQTNKGGQPLCFAIITNNYSGSTSYIKAKLFAILDKLK